MRHLHSKKLMKRIKELNTEERPYEKCERFGPENLTDSELLAVHEQGVTVEELYQKLGSDVTDYHREAVIV